jgi:hypothetical protein
MMEDCADLDEALNELDDSVFQNGGGKTHTERGRRRDGIRCSDAGGGESDGGSIGWREGKEQKGMDAIDKDVEGDNGMRKRLKYATVGRVDNQPIRRKHKANSKLDDEERNGDDVAEDSGNGASCGGDSGGGGVDNDNDKDNDPMLKAARRSMEADETDGGMDVGEDGEPTRTLLTPETARPRERKQTRVWAKDGGTAGDDVGGGGGSGGVSSSFTLRFPPSKEEIRRREQKEREKAIRDRYVRLHPVHAMPSEYDYDVAFYVVCDKTWQDYPKGPRDDLANNRSTAVTAIATITTLRSDTTKTLSKQERLYLNPATIPPHFVSRADSDSDTEIESDTEESSDDEDTTAPSPSPSSSQSSSSSSSTSSSSSHSYLKSAASRHVSPTSNDIVPCVAHQNGSDARNSSIDGGGGGSSHTARETVKRKDAMQRRKNSGGDGGGDGEISEDAQRERSEGWDRKEVLIGTETLRQQRAKRRSKRRTDKARARRVKRATEAERRARWELLTSYGWVNEFAALMDGAGGMVTFNADEQYGVLRKYWPAEQRSMYWRMRTLDLYGITKKKQRSWTGPKLRDVLEMNDIKLRPNMMVAAEALRRCDYYAVVNSARLHAEAMHAIFACLAVRYAGSRNLSCSMHVPIVMRARKNQEPPLVVPRMKINLTAYWRKTCAPYDLNDTHTCSFFTSPPTFHSTSTSSFSSSSSPSPSSSSSPSPSSSSSLPFSTSSLASARSTSLSTSASPVLAATLVPSRSSTAQNALTHSRLGSVVTPKTVTSSLALSSASSSRSAAAIQTLASPSISSPSSVSLRPRIQQQKIATGMLNRQQ